MAIHFDARARREDYDRIRAALKDNPNVTFARRRIKCGWGEWSLVQATLHAHRGGGRGVSAGHAFLHGVGRLHGDQVGRLCPCTSSTPRDVDYIESFDFFQSDWIKTGIKDERLIYRHWFNERQRRSGCSTPR